MIIDIDKAKAMLASGRAIILRYQSDGTELASLDHLPCTPHEIATASAEWDHDTGTWHWILDGDRGEVLHVEIKPASPAVALGRIKSPAKAAASRANGRLAPPRPKLPRCPACAGKPRRCAACVSTWHCRDCGAAITPGDEYGELLPCEKRREVVCGACAKLIYPGLRTYEKD